MPNTAVEFPERLECLFRPARYKILHGGRGGAKSWGIARALLIMGAERPLRILCGREIQKSIQESVHQLLRDQIAALGLSEFYDILQTEIRGANGTQFIFAGLKHNVDNIKSKEGIDIVWVEEAHNVSKTSWEKLIPTIRKPGSEIWVSFNPDLETDETYQRFVVSPPENAIVEHITWRDNPWFPEVLRNEMDDLRARDYDSYLTVWEGRCKQVLDGAIYANEIRKATEEGRICPVPYTPSSPVHTFWDLGRADLTSIWFVQIVGFEFRVIDYYENRGFALDHYVSTVQSRGYVYGTDWLPHDARNELLGSKRTIEQQMRDIGRKVRIVPKVSVANGINAARTVFGRCWFDQAKTADGLNALRRYRYDVNPDTGQYSQKPLHDDASHAADAFRYFAVAMEEPATERPKITPRRAVGGWMGG